MSKPRPSSNASRAEVAATTPRQRLDEALVARGLAETRSRARALILARDVMVNGAVVDRAGAPVRPTDEIALVAKARFVSRGGEKLDHALERFGIDVAGLIAADLGASTGGFTDCLLQRGAARVYAVDVGYGQLAEHVRLDPRAIVMDRTNARNLQSLLEPVDLVTVDVSFISLALVLPAPGRLLRRDGRCVPLIKPQFEAGPRDVGKGGVVRDPAVHRRVLEQTTAAARENGFGVLGLTASPLRGPAGNVEFLANLRLGAPSVDVEAAIAAALEEAATR
ncbi:MAG: TlyA family RNA methyltransferase [Thermomicrobiales bacterium]|nr:TlyA family RNA methyltransferase [Thermomicrobiales bacterium]